jgi:O-Antigen ligase
MIGERLGNLETRYKGWAGAVVVLTVATGSLPGILLGTKTHIVFTSQVVAVVYLLLRLVGPASAERLRGQGICAVLILSMAPALVVAPSFRSAVVAYTNYTTGVLAALIVATGFFVERSGSYIRRAIYWLPVITAIQLIFSLRNATQISAFHQNAHISWGDSNYVAALIIVWVTITIPYLIEHRRPKRYYLPLVFAAVVALLTLSRGATIAAAVSVASIIWWSTKGATWRLALRATVTFVPLVAILAVGYIGHLRSAQNHNAAVNVSSRFSLYRIALKDFENSPLVGHGWVSLRAESASAIGQQESFAHNLVASFLQMGGLTASPVIIFVIVATVTLCRRGSPLFPAALAGFAISMSDPFFEGYVGAMTMFGILIGGLLADRRGDAKHRSGEGAEIPTARNTVGERRVSADARR